MPPPAQGDDTARDKSLLEQINAMIKASSNTVRNDIATSEVNTGRRIDDLSTKLNSRLAKAEKDLSQLANQIVASKEEVQDLKTRVLRQESSLPVLIEAAVTKKLDQAINGAPPGGRRPRQIPPQFAPNDGNSMRADVKEERYWEARRSLRVWPVVGDDLKMATIQFCVDKLRCPASRIEVSNIEVSRAIARPDAAAQDQVVVTFDSVRLRDEIKSLGKNLSGQTRSIGMQLEPPDYLRPQYQAFQKLAFEMKKKSPGLRRNIKFSDAERCLVMDFLKPGAEWRTILYEDA